MGKKQLGELQPFEFAITLIVADLACIPMGDISVPISYGIVPIFTLFVIHLLVTKLVKHSIKLRKIVNGKPIIVINENGIDYDMISKLDMTVNDLLESLRGSGYFSPDEVEYAIVETNGDLSVLPKKSNSPMTCGDYESYASQDTAASEEKNEIPYTLICEGKLMSDNIKKSNVDPSLVTRVLEKYRYKQKEILLLTVRNKETLFLQPIRSACIVTSVNEVMS